MKRKKSEGDAELLKYAERIQRFLALRWLALVPKDGPPYTRGASWIEHYDRPGDEDTQS